MFGNSNPRINAAGLKDTWANFMTPQCIPPAQRDKPVEECSVIGAKAGDLTSYQKGNVAFDRGVTWASDPREERLDYIHVGHAPAFDQYASLPQHVSRANNLLVASYPSDPNYQIGASVGSVSAFSRDPANKLAGSLTISDHYGLNAELDDPAPHDEQNPGMSPFEALEIKLEDGVYNYPIIDPNKPKKSPKFAYPTAVHWYKITTPGEYAINVNPEFSNDNGPNNGIAYQVYENTDLSTPMAPY
jgi:hypothetical protein